MCKCVKPEPEPEPELRCNRLRASPWWFNERYCADAAVPDDPSQIGGPGENGWVSLEEWEAMPEGLKPLMAHRCHELGWDVTQQSVR